MVALEAEVAEEEVLVVTMLVLGSRRRMERNCRVTDYLDIEEDRNLPQTITQSRNLLMNQMVDRNA